MSTTPTARKIAVNISVEVDAEAWALTYGEEGSEIRAAVKRYVHNLVTQSAAADEGAIVDASVR